MRFREHRFAIAADISKMYRQVRVIPEQCTLQRILWRFAPEQEIQTYELQTVTYGEECSAFLAIRSLHQAAISMQHQFPETAEIIKRDFYVDDLLSGANDIKNLLRIKEEITEILRLAKFKLHKWKSNHSSIIQSDVKTSVQFSESTKILGQLWDTQFDTFCYTARPTGQQARLTKRHILSCIAQIFDPLGLLGPVIIRAKIIMQQLWHSQLTWDESLPNHLHTQWLRWYMKIAHLHHVKITRRILCNEPSRIELRVLRRVRTSLRGLYLC